MVPLAIHLPFSSPVERFGDVSSYLSGSNISCNSLSSSAAGAIQVRVVAPSGTRLLATNQGPNAAALVDLGRRQPQLQRSAVLLPSADFTAEAGAAAGPVALSQAWACAPPRAACLLVWLSVPIVGEDFVTDLGSSMSIGGPVDTTCPPKMVFIDTQTGDTVGDPYIFPDSVFSHTSGFPNDLVIDNAAQVAYISDTSPEGNGAIIVFDRSDRKSRRFHDDTMKPDTTGDIDWSSVNYPQGTAGFQATPQDGIALTPDGKRVYFTALGAVGMYSLSAMALRQHCKFCLLVLLFCLATEKGKEKR